MHTVDESDLIDCIYNSMSSDQSIPSPKYFQDRAIFAPGNDDVRLLNSKILQCHPGKEHLYHSTNPYSINTDSSGNNDAVPLEFLHSLNTSRLLIAELCLKVGCLIIILRNIDTK
jgi:hypothetical protein